MWRRWSDNQNGLVCLSLHRWQRNTLSKEYFWTHELIPSTRFHFPALLDHISSCKVLEYVCFCVHMYMCAGHYRVAILNAIKTYRGKWLGLNYSNECIDQSLLFCFHPPTKFVSLCWNTQRKTTYWVTKSHLESNISYYADSRTSDGVLLLNYTMYHRGSKARYDLLCSAAAVGVKDNPETERQVQMFVLFAAKTFSVL